MCPASETSTCESTSAAFCCTQDTGAGAQRGRVGRCSHDAPLPGPVGFQGRNKPAKSHSDKSQEDIEGCCRRAWGGGAAAHKGGGGTGKARREEAWRRRHQGRDSRETASAAFPVCLHPVLPETSQGGGQGGAGRRLRYSPWTMPGTEALLQQDPLSQARTLSPPLSHACDSAFTGPVRDDHSRPHAPTPVPRSRRRGGWQDRSRCI